MIRQDVNSRIIHTHDTEAIWSSITEFIPEPGELIVYDVDETHSYARLKIGDGKTDIKLLPFFNSSSSSLPTTDITGDLNIRGKLVIGNGEAIDSGSIAGGTTDKSVVEELAGELAASVATLNPAKALAPLSIAYGANNESIAPGSATLGVINTAGVKGYYWDSLTCDTENKQITIKLSTTRRSSLIVNPKYPSSVDWEVDDILCIKNGNWYNGYFSIKDISGNTITAELASGITTSTLPFTEISYTSVYSYDQPDDRTVYALQPVDDIMKASYVPRPGVVSIGFGAMALGGKNTSTGMLGIVKGRSNVTTGIYSDVSGNENIVFANSSIVSGRFHKVYGDTHNVFGYGNTVDGNNNSVSGKQNKIGSSNNNIVAGQANTVGNYVVDSYINGYQSNIGDNAALSFVQGLGCNTENYLTTAFGAFTNATAFGQFAIGRGNDPDEKTSTGINAIFMVGGVAPASKTDTSAPTTRKNAFTVFWDGTARVGADPVNIKDVATKGYVDNQTKILAAKTKTELSNYSLKSEAATKTYTVEQIQEGISLKTSKSWVFNTDNELHKWLNTKNLCNIPEITATDSTYEHQYSIIPDGKGYFAYRLDELGLTSGASTMTLTTVTLTPGTYTLSKSKYVYAVMDGHSILADDIEGNTTFTITTTKELIIKLHYSVLVDNYKTTIGLPSAHITDLFIQIEPGTVVSPVVPYTEHYLRDDGLTKADLKIGDLIFVNETTDFYYYWNGTQEVKRETSSNRVITGTISSVDDLETSTDTQIKDAPIGSLYICIEQ